MRESVIVSAVRTPTGRFLGALKSFTAQQLGACVVREAVRRAGIDAGIVDECIMGNVVSAGLGQNPARQAALNGGLPDHVAALTINKVCGSGLKAVMLADQAIRAGDIDAQRPPARIPHRDDGGGRAPERHAKRARAELDAATGRGTRDGCRGRHENQRCERASHRPITV